MPYKHGVTGQPVTLEVDGSSPFRVAILFTLSRALALLNMPL